MIQNYQDFLLEKEFNQIFVEFQLLESEGRWTGPNTYEWDLTKSNKKGYVESLAEKLKKFLEKLPLDKAKNYLEKSISYAAKLPKSIRRKVLIAISIAFLSILSISTLSSSLKVTKNEDIKKEFLQIIRKSNFKEAQELVRISEAGYSSDRKDRGNWIKVPGGKRFVGTKYGISAPVLRDFFNRLPKAEDMRNLKYETALEIYKKKYWDPQNLSEFSDQNIANILYDGCVNQGIEGTKQVLREALKKLGVNISDSENPFSKNWIIEVNGLEQQEELFDTLKEKRKERYSKAVTYKTHGEGWISRLDSINYKELDL